MGYNFDWLKGESKKITEKANKYADFQSEVTKLPYELKEGYRKAGDPALDEKINNAQQETLGGAIVGLDKYKDISNPFTRRALAEGYQSGLSKTYNNLTDERTRRNGVMADYIEKWTGMFGAEAAKKQAEVQNMESEYNRNMAIEDKKVSQSRWEIENARAERNSTTTKDTSQFMAYAKEELNKSVGEDGKYDPKVYNRLRDEGLKYKIDKDAFDSEASYGVNERDYGNLGIKTSPKDYSAINADEKAKGEIETREKVNKFKETVKKDEGNAKYGEYYWKNGKVFKKINWGKDKEVSPEEAANL